MNNIGVRSPLLVLTRTTCIIIDGCRKVNYGEVEAR